MYVHMTSVITSQIRAVFIDQMMNGDECLMLWWRTGFIKLLLTKEAVLITQIIFLHLKSNQIVMPSLIFKLRSKYFSYKN